MNATPDGSGEERSDRPGEGSHALGDVLDELGKAADSPDGVRVGTLVASFGRRGYGALLLVPATLEMSPVGGIPGVPSVLALVVALFSVQVILGRHCMWLPGFLTNRRLPGAKLASAVDRARPWTARLDRWFHGRLDVLTGPHAARVAAGVCVVLACTVPPLEIVPFASTAPMAAIALFGVALLVHDGLVMLVAFVLSIAAFGVLGGILN